MLKSKNERKAGDTPLINLQNKISNNHVGGGQGSVRPKQNRGITLIALIITIIVMLILVAVTINVALDTGLFGTAKKSAYQTEVSTIKEQLEIAKVAKVAENGGQTPADFGLTINDLSIEEKLKTKYGSKLVISEDGTLFYKGNIVTDEEEQNWLKEIGINEYDETLELVRKYFLGPDETGRDYTEIIESGSEIKFKDDPESIKDASTTITFVNMLFDYENVGYDWYVLYSNKVYKIEMVVSENETTMLAKSVSVAYAPQGNEGKDLGEITGEEKYKGWIILYDDLNGTVQAISPKTMGSLTLGYNDSTVNWEDAKVIEEANIDGEEGLTDIEKSIYSYNHAIETINNYCKDQIPDDIATDENVRSIGTTEDTTEMYNEIQDDWETSKYNGKLKNTFGYYEIFEQDWLRIMNFAYSYYLSRRRK